MSETLLDFVRHYAEEIRKADGEDEAQHAKEDGLHLAILAAIRDGTCTWDEAREATKIAWEIHEMLFNRWYA